MTSGQLRRLPVLCCLCILVGVFASSCGGAIKGSNSETGQDSNGYSAPTAENQDSSTAPAVTDTPIESAAPDLLRAQKLLEAMTLEQKVGQMFFASWVSGDVTEAIRLWQFGGIVLFAPDFEHSDPLTITDTIQTYQSTAATPLLIGVDEEGDTVVRISRFPQFRAERYQSPQALFEQGGMDAIRSDTAEKAQFLLDLGINVNLAPVCDVSTNETDFIYKRSFGQDATATSAYVTTVIEEMKRLGLGCSLKHFPGYGNNVDTHTGIAMDQRAFEVFVASDFLPFEAGIAAGAGSVMVSHNIVYCMDELLPASLSPNVHRILREDLGFQGVIMTDDLSMDAIKDYTEDREAAVLAVLAGNDMIIGSAYAEQIPAVIAAVQNGEIDEAVIDEAVIRILLWKISLGLIE